ncbi:CYTH domain-containing protein [Bacillus swezeyi]|uniref:CYTH domain-containing protein n=1 Tax=Bacillus swezeyi TaxID=1925020 RepID=A0A1R1QC19_9BACI|nr:CYTH domain-containing protein [Bacillus swezeyi]MEC1261519.1 CYTH domain-containing protein [Bacillus swezeyi]MED2926618.1 CYTH domain-containing protein [Bacillus swezeyi]MED2944089.1 CYTH domain-containing protein [Bacillus swezeyi]MED2965820.1 CYTH domain-containing protein [Bacillus swezeyi]MED3070777.1 CYTH domain-containing protein [Bacillus swezeyi]
MSQELEIEFKNLLTKKEFDQMKLYYQFSPKQFVTQKNHYYDTPSFSLKEKGAALRVREKQDRHVLTLKEPAPVGLTETHQSLPFQPDVESFHIPDGPVLGRLRDLGIESESLQYFGTLTTDRAEKKLPQGLIVLDRSRYLMVEDYEVEFEVTDYEQGKQDFTAILKSFGIPPRDTKNKIVRFYEQKLKDK